MDFLTNPQAYIKRGHIHIQVFPSLMRTPSLLLSAHSYTFMLVIIALFLREGAKSPNDSLGSLKSSFSFLCVSLFCQDVQCVAKSFKQDLLRKLFKRKKVILCLSFCYWPELALRQPRIRIHPYLPSVCVPFLTRIMPEKRTTKHEIEGKNLHAPLSLYKFLTLFKDVLHR